MSNQFPNIHQWNMDGSAETHYVLESVYEGVRYTKMYPVLYYTVEAALNDFKGKVSRKEKMGP